MPDTDWIGMDRAKPTERDHEEAGDVEQNEDEVPRLIGETFDAMFATGIHVDGQQVPDDAAREELKELAPALLAEREALASLRTNHKVDLGSLFAFLAERRLTWRYGNPFSPFRQWSVDQLEAMPEKLKRTADDVEEAKQFLIDYMGLSWSLAHEEASSDGESSSGFREEDAPLMFINSFTGEPTKTFRWEKSFFATAESLRSVASTVASVDWRHWRDPNGRPLFKPGRRGTLAYEADTGHVLVNVFQRETGNALYEYVGLLLRATFPTLRDWQSSPPDIGEPGKRMRDRVKSLLRSYPSEQTEKRSA